MNRKLLTWITGLVVIAVLSWSGHYILNSESIDYDAKSLTPILPLSQTNLNIPNWDLILRDPAIKVEKITDDIAYEQALSEYRGLTSDLKRAKGLSRKMIYKSMYLKQISMIRFLEEVSSGRLHSFGYQEKSSAMLKNIRKSLRDTVNGYVKYEKNMRKKSRMLYQVLIADYLSHRSSRSLTSLNKISKFLPSFLKRRVVLLKLSKRRVLNHKSLAEIKRIKRKLPKSGSMAANLIIAQHYAYKRSSQYKRFLSRALVDSRSFSKPEKKRILASAVKIWRKAEPRGSWLKVPFSLKYLGNDLNTLAIRERQALESFQKSGVRSSVRRYQHLATKVHHKKYSILLDKRMVELESRGYRKSQNARGYEKVLISKINKYKNIDSSSKDHLSKQVVTDLKRQYRHLVFSLLSKAEKSKNLTSSVKESIRISLNYIQRSESKSDHILIKEKVARIYAKVGSHNLAVKMYDHLLLSGDPSKKITYIGLAIDSQRVQASWPKSAPFRNIPQGSLEARRKLLSYYGMLHGQSKIAQWPILGHIGLLQISLGNAETAFKLWTNALKIESRGPEASKASGLMFVAFHRSKRWEKLENLADLAIEKGIIPQGVGVKTPKSYLGDALFFGGKELFQKKQYQASWKKLERFTKTFKYDKRRDEALYILAHAYRHDRKFQESVESLVKHVVEYKKSPFRSKALLFGGKWSMEMAFEEQVIFFYQTFINEFPGHKRALEVRGLLVNLYLGKELYGDASRVHQGLIRSNASRGLKEQSALAVMHIEEKYGSVEDASWGAKEALKYSGSSKSMSEVLAFYARQAIKDKNAKHKLMLLDKKASNLDLRDPETLENVAEIKFLLAESSTSWPEGDVFNIGIENHTKALDEYYGKFHEAKKLYDRICDFGDTSFCAPAMNKVALATDEAVRIIEEINIQEILDQKTVLAFKDKKQQIISSLTHHGMKANERAYELANQGLTTPDYANEIIWENSNDWNFEHADGTSGNTYTQWSVGGFDRE